MVHTVVSYNEILKVRTDGDPSWEQDNIATVALFRLVGRN